MLTHLYVHINAKKRKWSVPKMKKLCRYAGGLIRLTLREVGCPDSKMFTPHDPSLSLSVCLFLSCLFPASLYTVNCHIKAKYAQDEMWEDKIRLSRWQWLIILSYICIVVTNQKGPLQNQVKNWSQEKRSQTTQEVIFRRGCVSSLYKEHLAKDSLIIRVGQI